MNQCWFCKKDVGFNEGELEKICQNCGVLCDRKPDGTEIGTQQKEEEVADLRKWATENAKFIKIGDGESYEGVYKGNKEGLNMNGEPAICYNLDGKEFKSSSTSLADNMAEVEEGSKVRITRAGEGFNTRWKVEVI